jgi:hypothetical protein
MTSRDRFCIDQLQPVHRPSGPCRGLLILRSCRLGSGLAFPWRLGFRLGCRFALGLTSPLDLPRLPMCRSYASIAAPSRRCRNESPQEQVTTNLGPSLRVPVIVCFSLGPMLRFWGEPAMNSGAPRPNRTKRARGARNRVRGLSGIADHCHRGPFSKTRGNVTACVVTLEAQKRISSDTANLVDGPESLRAERHRKPHLSGLESPQRDPRGLWGLDGQLGFPITQLCSGPPVGQVFRAPRSRRYANATVTW